MAFEVAGSDQRVQDRLRVIRPDVQQAADRLAGQLPASRRMQDAVALAGLDHERRTLRFRLRGQDVPGAPALAGPVQQTLRDHRTQALPRLCGAEREVLDRPRRRQGVLLRCPQQRDTATL